MNLIIVGVTFGISSGRHRLEIIGGGIIEDL
jgi:hypothetical protein